MSTLHADPLPHPNDNRHAVATTNPGAAAVVLNCPTSRLFALSRLIAALEEFEPEQIDQLQRGGMTPELADRVRKLTMSDAWRVTRRHCGLSVMVDLGRFTSELNRLQMLKQEQALIEHFVRNGATAAMLSRLFNETPTRVRQLRAQIGPSIDKGRPRMPDEDARERIRDDWAAICKEIPTADKSSDRARFKALLDRWPAYQLCTLDAVVNAREYCLDFGAGPSSSQAASLRSQGTPNFESAGVMRKGKSRSPS